MAWRLERQSEEERNQAFHDIKSLEDNDCSAVKNYEDEYQDVIETYIEAKITKDCKNVMEASCSTNISVSSLSKERVWILELYQHLGLPSLSDEQKIQKLSKLKSRCLDDPSVFNDIAIHHVHYCEEVLKHLFQIPNFEGQQAIKLNVLTEALGVIEEGTLRINHNLLKSAIESNFPELLSQFLLFLAVDMGKQEEKLARLCKFGNMRANLIPMSHARKYETTSSLLEVKDIHPIVLNTITIFHAQLEHEIDFIVREPCGKEQVKNNLQSFIPLRTLPGIIVGTFDCSTLDLLLVEISFQVQIFMVDGTKSMCPDQFYPGDVVGLPLKDVVWLSFKPKSELPRFLRGIIVGTPAFNKQQLTAVWLPDLAACAIIPCNALIIVPKDSIVRSRSTEVFLAQVDSPPLQPVFDMCMNLLKFMLKAGLEVRKLSALYEEEGSNTVMRLIKTKNTELRSNLLKILVEILKNNEPACEAYISSDLHFLLADQLVWIAHANTASSSSGSNPDLMNLLRALKFCLPYFNHYFWPRRRDVLQSIFLFLNKFEYQNRLEKKVPPNNMVKLLHEIRIELTRNSREIIQNCLEDKFNQVHQCREYSHQKQNEIPQRKSLESQNVERQVPSATSDSCTHSQRRSFPPINSMSEQPNYLNKDFQSKPSHNFSKENQKFQDSLNSKKYESFYCKQFGKSGTQNYPQPCGNRYEPRLSRNAVGYGKMCEEERNHRSNKYHHGFNLRRPRQGETWSSEISQAMKYQLTSRNDGVLLKTAVDSYQYETLVRGMIFSKIKQSLNCEVLTVNNLREVKQMLLARLMCGLLNSGGGELYIGLGKSSLIEGVYALRSERDSFSQGVLDVTTYSLVPRLLPMSFSLEKKVVLKNLDHVPNGDWNLCVYIIKVSPLQNTFYHVTPDKHYYVRRAPDWTTVSVPLSTLEASLDTKIMESSDQVTTESI